MYRKIDKYIYRERQMKTKERERKRNRDSERGIKRYRDIHKERQRGVESKGYL